MDIPIDAAPQEVVASPPPRPRLSGTLPLLAVAEPLWRRLLYAVVTAAVIVGFFCWSFSYWVPAHQGVDQNGYLVGGKMFAEHFSSGLTPPDMFSFVGKMWFVEPKLADAATTTQLTFYPKYPLGLPVLVAITLWIGKSNGPLLTYLISPVATIAALAGAYLLMRRVMRTFPALLGVIVIATSPATVGLSNNPNSHASTMCCVVWGMYLLIRWWQSGNIFRAIAAGFLLGYAFTIRYTEGLLLVPVALVALFNLRWRDRRSWIQSSTLVLSWAVPVGLLLLFNWRAFGSLTGYDPTNESTGFSWEYFQQNWETMARTLSSSGLYFILPFSALGLILMFAWNWRLALVMAGWILPTIGIYTAYYWAPDGQTLAYMRFFLTIVPPLAMTAMWGLDHLVLDSGAVRGAARTLGRWTKRISIDAARWRTGLAAIAMGLIVSAAGAVGVNTAKETIENDQRSSLNVANATQKLMAAAPSPKDKESILFTGSQQGGRGFDSLLNHLQFATNYCLYTSESFNRGYVLNLRNTRDPDQPQFMQPQRAKNLYEQLRQKSDSELIEEQNKIMSNALAEGRRVFVLVSSGEAARFRQRFVTHKFRSETVASWQENVLPRRDRRTMMGFGRPNLDRFFGRGGERESPTWLVLEIKASK